MRLDDYEARIAALEQETADALIALLQEARDVMQRRLEGLPTEGAEARVIPELLAANTRAMAKVRARVPALAATHAEAAAAIGVETAVLPRVEATVSYLYPQTLIEEAARFTAEHVVGLTREAQATVSRQMQVGILAGTSRDDLIRQITGTGLQRVGTFLSAEHRADAIVVTETNGIANRAAYARYEDAATRIPGLQKRWVTARDGRVRETHAVLSGVTIPMDEMFDVGGVMAPGPHAAALPAREATRCRCRLVTELPEEEGA